MPLPTIDKPANLAAVITHLAEERLNPPAGNVVALVGVEDQVRQFLASPMPDDVSLRGDDAHTSAVLTSWLRDLLPGLVEQVTASAATRADVVVFLGAFLDAGRVDLVEAVECLTVLHDALEDTGTTVHEAVLIDHAGRRWLSILADADFAPIPDLGIEATPVRRDPMPVVDDNDPTLTPRLPQETDPR